MNYIYHLVPGNMKGHYLVPLNQLKEVWPETYAEASKKYEGRENIMEVRLPILNCLWNDVLHFTPIHPNTIATAVREAGRKSLPERKWFKIPIERILELPAIELETLGLMYREGQNYILHEQDARPLRRAGFQELSEVPAWTRAYYTQEIAHGRSPLLFNGALHILVQGRLSIEGVEVIDWLSKPPI